MDKILANKFLGLKVEDILKCVLLVGVGYCIAVMLGNLNCVEGLPFVCSAQTACSREKCMQNGNIDPECQACPGWQLKDPDDGTEPWITTPSRLYTCADGGGSGEGYGSMAECVANTPYSLAEEPMGLLNQRTGVPECNAAPPYPPPAPPPTPPAPPTPPSTCSYYGDKDHPEQKDSAALDTAFWNNRSDGATCQKSKEECRSAWKLWANETGNPYTGFCIQTLKGGKHDDLGFAGSVRGDCPLGPGKAGEQLPDGWILDESTGTPEENCTSLVSIGNPAARGGDFAWVNETSAAPCSCGESATDNSATPGGGAPPILTSGAPPGGGSPPPGGGGGGAPSVPCYECPEPCNADVGGQLCCSNQPTMWSIPCAELLNAGIAYGGPEFPNAPWNRPK